MDFSANGRYLIASCEFSGKMVKVDVATRTVLGTLDLPGGVSADGEVLWLSGRYSHEVYAIDTGDGHLLARIRVGKGPRGCAFTRNPAGIRWAIRAFFGKRMERRRPAK